MDIEASVQRMRELCNKNEDPLLSDIEASVQRMWELCNENEGSDWEYALDDVRASMVQWILDPAKHPWEDWFDAGMREWAVDENGSVLPEVEVWASLLRDQL